MPKQNSTPSRTKTSTLQSPLLRNIALTFVVVTMLLAGAVFYLALGRATVVVHLGDVSREIGFRFELAEERLDRPLPQNALPASFFETTETVTDTFVPSGTTERTGRAGGTVTLHNETERDQPLVATTRLLTADGKLFRLVSAVRVPANGTIDALVAADQDGAEYEIPATRFTIPGLNASLQTSIYATSSASMVRGATEEKTVTKEDLETARQTLKTRFLEKTKQTLSEQLSGRVLRDEDIILVIEKEDASVSEGAKARSFTMTLTLKSIAVVFDEADLLARIQASGQGVTIDSLENAAYSILNYDPTARSAIISGKVGGQSSLSASSSIFNTANFVGMTVQEVVAYLKNYNGVENAEVELSPSWLNVLPRAPSRIEVKFE